MTRRPLNLARILRRAKTVCVPLAIVILSAVMAAGGQAQSPSAPGGPQLSPPPAASDQASSAGQNTLLHILVGRSMIMDTPERLRRVYVSNPLVLESLTATPQQLVVTAKAPGTSSLVLWEANGDSLAYTVSADLDISGLTSSLERSLAGENLDAYSEEGRVYLSGTVSSDAALDYVQKMAMVYSKDVVNAVTVISRHSRQVQLKVRFAEVDRSKLDQLGINLFSNNSTFSGATSTQQFGAPVLAATQTGGIATTVTPSDLLNLFLYDKALDIGMTVKALQDTQVLQILAEPTITTISGQQARFLSGGLFPYPVVQGTSGGLTSITIQFQPYGVKLDFTPFANADGSIRLKVAPEVSALDYTNSVTISGYTIPAISTRRAETEIELKDGQSFGISGLLDRRTTEQLSKVPGIGDIPILGELFRSRNVNRSFTELIVIVTPTLVNPLAENNLPPPASPSMPIPFLEPGKFDSQVKPHSKLPKDVTGPPAGH